MGAVLQTDFQTFKAHLAADKKKAAILGVLFVVLLGVVGRLFFSGSTPDPAVAVPPAAVAPARRALTRTVPEMLDKAAGNRSTLTSPRVSFAPRGPDDIAREKAVSVDGISRNLARDIFSTTSWSTFPRALERPPAGEESGATAPSAPSVFARFGRRWAVEQKAHQERIASDQAEFAGLRLQSTLIGSLRSAYISGRLVHSGDTIRGFSVVRIEERRVTLRKSGATFTLSMP